MKYQKIVNNKEINAYLKKGDANLGTMGFTEVTYYSIHLVIIVYSYLLFCYTPFKKQFWRIRNATLSCYTY